MSYKLYKLSERIRALENGRSIFNVSYGVTYRAAGLGLEDEELDEFILGLVVNCKWKLILKKDEPK